VIAYLEKLKDQISNDWSIRTSQISPNEADLINVAEIAQHTYRFVKAGKIRQLLYKDQLIMDTTYAELLDLLPLKGLRGRILINGLGLGIACNLVRTEQVTVVEKSIDVIKMVAPLFTESNINIVHDSAFTYVPTGYYDYVWHDIWPDITHNNLSEMVQLTDKYLHHARRQGCWAYHECQQVFNERYLGKA